MSRIIQICFFVCLASQLVAGVFDHIHPIGRKGNQHSIENVDCIYLINLDERPEKWAHCENELNPHNIYPYRFSAVNGWKLSNATLKDVGLKFKSGMKSNVMGTRYDLDVSDESIHGMVDQKGVSYFCHCMSRGAV